MMKKSKNRRVLISTLLVIGHLIAWRSSALSKAYLLGADDKIQVRVYDLRTGTADVHDWSSISGVYTVSQAGTISVPLVGEVIALDKTTVDVANDIAIKLQHRVGLTQKPDSSVEVITYRPFFISGGVNNPGVYPYRPNLTVVQAVALAGGLPRLAEVDYRQMRQALRLKQDELNAAESERLGLMIQRSRLSAVIEGKSQIEFSVPVNEGGEYDYFREASKMEKLRLKYTSESTKERADTFIDTTKLLEREILTLGEKAKSVDQQLELAKNDMDNVSSLVSKGLSITQRQIAAAQLVAQLSAQKLDVELTTLRAQQDVRRTRRELLDLTAQQKREALSEAPRIDSQIAIIDSKIKAIIRTVDNIKSELKSEYELNNDKENILITYTISRIVNNTMIDKTVDRASEVQPGDTLSVIINLRQGR